MSLYYRGYYSQCNSSSHQYSTVKGPDGLCKSRAFITLTTPWMSILPGKGIHEANKLLISQRRIPQTRAHVLVLKIFGVPGRFYWQVIHKIRAHAWCEGFGKIECLCRYSLAWISLTSRTFRECGLSAACRLRLVLWKVEEFNSTIHETRQLASVKLHEHFRGPHVQGKLCNRRYNFIALSLRVRGAKGAGVSSQE